MLKQQDFSALKSVLINIIAIIEEVLFLLQYESIMRVDNIIQRINYNQIPIHQLHFFLKMFMSV